MKRAALILVAMLTCGGAFGCSTKVAYIANDSQQLEAVDPRGQFSLGKVSDLSGFKFAPKDINTLDLVDSMTVSMQLALTKYPPRNRNKQYIINIDILEYDPGNAAKRYFLPGSGKTKLSIKATVSDENGNIYATVPVERSIGWGILGNPNAWKTVFDEVSWHAMRNIIAGAKRYGRY